MEPADDRRADAGERGAGPGVDADGEADGAVVELLGQEQLLAELGVAGQRAVGEAEAIGLVVPGMPIGSPGMESGDRREAYEVLLLKRGGKTEVFARYE